MSCPVPVPLPLLRQQFEVANDVQTPAAAIAIASTFGVANACGSDANQDDSENDVRMFGIVQQSGVVRASGSICPPRSSALGNDSAPASDIVTVTSADCRRTASEQAHAAKQFVEEQHVLPASSAKADAGTSLGGEHVPQAPQQGAVVRPVSHRTDDQEQGCSASHAGTVRETQTDATPASTASAGRAGRDPAHLKRVHLKRAHLSQAAVSCDLMSALLGREALDRGEPSEVHTIMDSQRGSSQGKHVIAEKVDAAHMDEYDGPEPDDFPSTQLEEGCGVCSIQATQLQSAAPSCYTVSIPPTQRETGNKDVDLQTPTHSTDTQPADAPFSGNDLANVEKAAAVDLAGVAISSAFQDCGGSIDPLRSGSAQKAAARAGAGAASQLAAESMPQLPFDESGNLLYVSARPSHTCTQPDDASTDAGLHATAADAVSVANIDPTVGCEVLPNYDRATAPGLTNAQVAEGAFPCPGSYAIRMAEQEHPQVHASPDRPLPEANGDNSKHRPDCLEAEPGVDAVPSSAAPATGLTQATVCDSSDGEPDAPDVGCGGSELKQTKPAEESNGCQSSSRGTVPETHTGDGHAKAPSSQQTVRRRRSTAAPRPSHNADNTICKASKQTPVADGGTPLAGQTPPRHVALRAAPSASRGSVQLAAIQACTGTKTSTTDSAVATDTPGKSGSIVQHRPSPQPGPAAAGQATKTPELDIRMDRVARKRKSKQQQSARISRVVAHSPMPSPPAVQLKATRRTPSPHPGPRSNTTSPHVSALLELAAGLRDAQHLATPTKRRRIAPGNVAATPQNNSMSPSPGTSRRPGYRMPNNSEPANPAGTSPRAAHRDRPADRPQPKTGTTPGRAVESQPKTMLVSSGPTEVCKDHQTVPQICKIAAIKPDLHRNRTGEQADGGQLAGCSKRTEASIPAAAAVMTESQLSLQNWIDDRPLARTSQRRNKRPDPPRFSDNPVRSTAQASPLKLATASPEADRGSAADPLHAPPAHPDSEELEIQQVRSFNKIACVLDSQTAEMFQPHPEDLTPPEKRARVIVQGAVDGVTSHRELVAVTSKAPDLAPPTAAVQVRGTRTSADRLCPTSPAGSLNVAKSIPCVFVSSQQGTKSCVRQQNAQPLVVQQAPAEGRKQESQGQETRMMKHGAADLEGTHSGATKMHGGRSSSAPRVRHPDANQPAGNAPAHVAQSTVPTRQSAPAGGAWQQRRSRVNRSSPRVPDDDSTRNQPPRPRTPQQARPEHLQELSPGGGVRRSARIAAHNIAPAADGDKAFGAIGALSQAWSLSIADMPMSPKSPQPAVGLHKPSAQGLGDLGKSDTNSRHMASKPSSPVCPSAKQSSHKRPALRPPRPSRARTPVGAACHDENQQVQGNRTPTRQDSRGKTATPQKLVERRQAAVQSATGMGAGHDASPAKFQPEHVTHKRSVQKGEVIGNARTSVVAVQQKHVSTQEPAQEHDLSWGQAGDCCSAWKRTYTEFFSRQWGHVKIGDVVSADAVGVGKLYLQVERLWSNRCTKEDCMAGTRLYPVLDTPFAMFVPGGIDKHRALALGDDKWILPRNSFRQPLRVVYMGCGDSCVSESDAKKSMQNDPSCFLCHFRLEASGGLFPL